MTVAKTGKPVTKNIIVSIYWGFDRTYYSCSSVRKIKWAKSLEYRPENNSNIRFADKKYSWVESETVDFKNVEKLIYSWR